MRRQREAPSAETMAGILESVTEASTICGASAVKLRGVFEGQGWSPQVAEQMAHEAYGLMLLGGGR